MEEKFIIDTLQERISSKLDELHATKASGGWYMKATRALVIVVKNPDASWVGIGNFCPCTD